MFTIDIINNIYIGAAGLFGLLGIAFEWVYVLEGARGLVVLEAAIYKKYVNYLFWISNAILIILWLTSDGTQDMKLLIAFGCMALLWLFTSVAVLVISVASRKNAQVKAILRNAVFPCIIKMGWLVGITWLLI